MRAGITRAISLAVCLAAAATSLAAASPSGPDQAAQGQTVLRVGLSRWSSAPVSFFDLDPQVQYWAGGYSMLSCCLVRTLMGYPDVPTDEGGGDLLPDLAAEFPTVSPDGLTWTFHLKQGLHYAPPLQDTEITAPDIVRAIERAASLGDGLSYADPYFAPIEGFDRMMQGHAKAISGLATPDPYTLEVNLTQPVGDVGERLAVPAAAPIAPFEDRRFGVAQKYGPWELGAHAVSSGPYMFEGSPSLDFSKPGGKAHPLYRTKDTTWVWVRNPSFVASSDPLRAALPDRIEFAVTSGSSPSVEVVNAHYDRVVNWVRDGAVDMAMTESGRGMTPDARDAWGRDPQWRGAMVPALPPQETFLGFRVAVPPFDDVHVRRAVALAMDRQAFVVGSHGDAIAQTHLTLDQYTESILQAYDPYPGNDLRAAASEMARSSYDADHDGRCDAAACRHVVLGCVCLAEEEAVMQPLGALGMHVTFEPLPYVYPDMGDTSMGMYVLRWGYDWQDAYTLFAALLSSHAAPPSSTLLGQRPSALRSYGYAVTDVPSLEPAIRACEPLVGPVRAACWARAEQYEMEQVVALLPLGRWVAYFAKGPAITSFGVMWTGVPALDRMAVATS